MSWKRLVERKNISTLDDKMRMIEGLAKLEYELKSKEEELRNRADKLKLMEVALAKEEGRIAWLEIERREKELDKERVQQKAKTGIPRLDELLLGGIPFGSCVLIYSAPFAGAEIFMNRFIAEGLCKGVPCVVVTVDRSADDLRQELKDFIEGYEQAEKAKLISYVDIYSKRMGMIFERRDNVEYVPTFKDVDLINLAVNETLNRVKEKSGYCRVVFPLSTLATSLKAQELFRLIGDLTTKCRRKKAVALYSLTKGIYSNNEVQVIRNLTDGVIELKEDNQRTFLAVQGMCDVQTRAWVEYKAKGKDLIIGSFHLDYIR